MRKSRERNFTTGCENGAGRQIRTDQEKWRETMLIRGKNLNTLTTILN